MIVASIFLSMGLMLALVDILDDDSDNSSDNDTVEDAVIEGDEQNDTIMGTNGLDIIDGKGGDDDLTGREGGDIIIGGEGNDLIKGRAGDDFLQGGEGDDSLRGGLDNDVLIGGAGDDVMYGAEGDDTLIGANAFSRDLTVEDVIAMAKDPSHLPEGYEDAIPSEAEANYLNGGEGDDVLILGNDDTGVRGEGDDVFHIGHWVADGQDAPIIEDYTDADDILMVQYVEGETAPTITVQDVNNETHVFANGNLVARLSSGPGAIAVDDVQLLAV
ncbi:MAG: calcium-binding protein [Shimia sp.]|nr:calcium-binding protein [Shimia sp.]